MTIRSPVPGHAFPRSPFRHGFFVRSRRRPADQGRHHRARHVARLAFTKAMNDKTPKGRWPRSKSWRRYPGGSPDVPASRDRVEGYTKQLREMGVEIVGTIDELLAQGRRRAAWKVSTVDRIWNRPSPSSRPASRCSSTSPWPASLADAVAIYKPGRRKPRSLLLQLVVAFQPWHPGHAARTNELASILGCDAFGPCARRASS